MDPEGIHVENFSPRQYFAKCPPLECGCKNASDFREYYCHNYAPRMVMTLNIISITMRGYGNKILLKKGLRAALVY